VTPARVPSRTSASPPPSARVIEKHAERERTLGRARGRKRDKTRATRTPPHVDSRPMDKHTIAHEKGGVDQGTTRSGRVSKPVSRLTSAPQTDEANANYYTVLATDDEEAEMQTESAQLCEYLPTN
jgi:hypothetical protein